MSDNQKTGPEPSGSKAGAKASAGSAQTRVVIKKYANRRLYNTASSSYVTLEHLSEMVKEGVDFVVFDAKTNEDITRSVLTQIIFDEESRGQNLLPIQFLRQLIGFYGNSMQAFLPSYLELSLDSFTRQQERMRTQFGAIAPALAPGLAPGLAPSLASGLAPGLSAGLGAAGGPQFLEEQVKQNLAMFDRAMKMFSPFAYVRPEDSDVAAPATSAAAPSSAPPAAPPAASAAAAASSAPADDSLNDLKKKIEEMQEQIARLASKG